MKNAGQVLVGVQVSEKGTRLSEKENKYLFRVADSANKIEIKRAVEEVFKVGVTAVNTMNCRGKQKRARNGKIGKRPDWKRAVVTLKEGDRIDLT